MGIFSALYTFKGISRSECQCLYWALSLSFTATVSLDHYLNLYNSKQKGLLEVHCLWKSSCQNLSMQISDVGLCFYLIQRELSGIFKKATFSECESDLFLSQQVSLDQGLGRIKSPQITALSTGLQLDKRDTAIFVKRLLTLHLSRLRFVELVCGLHGLHKQACS